MKSAFHVWLECITFAKLGMAEACSLGVPLVGYCVIGMRLVVGACSLEQSTLFVHLHHCCVWSSVGCLDSFYHIFLIDELRNTFGKPGGVKYKWIHWMNVHSIIYLLYRCASSRCDLFTLTVQYGLMWCYIWWVSKQIVQDIRWRRHKHDVKP